MSKLNLFTLNNTHPYLFVTATSFSFYLIGMLH